MSKKIIAVVGSTGAQGGGLVRAILSDPASEFAVRALTREPDSEKAQELARLGAQVVHADVDDSESLRHAFAGAYGAYCVTFYWAHFSPERETAEAKAMAVAAKDAGLQHVIWSTLEDTRKFVPLTDNRMPTLMERYKVPHFDGKGEADAFFSNLNLPVTFSAASFYWENFIYFGMGPKRVNGALTLRLPISDKKMTGIGAEDIGKCIYGVFRRREEFLGKHIGLAGEALTGAQMAAALSKALGKEVRYDAISADAYRRLGFPGAEDLGNMFQFYADFEPALLASRDVALSRSLNPALQSFEQWLERNADRIPVD